MNPTMGGIPGPDRMLGDPLSPYWSYMLRCSNAGIDPDGFDRWWMRDAAAANVCVYIGSTNNPEQRITDHVEGAGPEFTRTFQPVEVDLVRGWPTRAAAQAHERELKSVVFDEAEPTEVFAFQR